ncbi:hypothetical protein Q5P01_000838 [Channa striata]|uniref:Uncharacterized protein n=1 Tax=Channa striata TaxID=64152 RepID=A0AA88IWV4_CHASR|nr:hypothetical protein Q5P01_000838 [Channa striata]
MLGQAQRGGERVVLFKHLVASGLGGGVVEPPEACRKPGGGMIGSPLARGVDRGGIVFDQGAVGFRLSRPARRRRRRSGAEEARARRPACLARVAGCSLRISFMRDREIGSLERTGELFGALVQFGNAPITAMVNLQWKREVLEKHVAAGAAERNRAEGNSELRPGQSTDSARSREPRPKGVRWKRPLCTRKKREEAEGARGRQSG